jgi:hypothetical protein
MSNDDQIVEEEIRDVKDLFKNFDKIILDSVESGIESGRSIGILESYNFLVKEGYPHAAEALLVLVNEDEKTRKERGDA